MPPMRKVRPCGASLAAICDGVKKNTRFSLNAESTSAVAAPRATTPITIAAIRLCLGFTGSFHQEGHFESKTDKGNAIRAPYIPGIPTHGEEFTHPRAPG